MLPISLSFGVLAGAAVTKQKGGEERGPSLVAGARKRAVGSRPGIQRAAAIKFDRACSPCLCCSGGMRSGTAPHYPKSFFSSATIAADQWVGRFRNFIPQRLEREVEWPATAAAPRNRSRTRAMVLRTVRAYLSQVHISKTRSSVLTVPYILDRMPSPLT